MRQALIYGLNREEIVEALLFGLVPRADFYVPPDDPLAKKAIYQIGRAYQSIAYYDKAAENYETFAMRFPGEKEPTDASTACT